MEWLLLLFSDTTMLWHRMLLDIGWGFATLLLR